MSDKRFSGWAVLGIMVAVLAVAGVAVAGGVFVGFNIGRATADRALLPRVFGRGFVMPFQRFDEMPYYRFQQPQPRPFADPPQTTAQPYLGVAFQMLTAELAEQHDLPVDEGAWIVQVIDGSPADQAELRVGDVILAVDGREVTASRTLAKIIAQFEPGDEVELELRRGPRALSVDVELGRRPASDRLLPEFEN